MFRMWIGCDIVPCAPSFVGVNVRTSAPGEQQQHNQDEEATRPDYRDRDEGDARERY
jgi:hypothetical protein